MPQLKPIKAEKLIKLLSRLGFNALRQTGSHVVMKHPDGRTTVIPLHKGELIDRQLLRKIIRDELKMSRDEFLGALEEN